MPVYFFVIFSTNTQNCKNSQKISVFLQIPISRCYLTLHPKRIDDIYIKTD